MSNNKSKDVLPQSGNALKGRYVFTDLQIEVAKLRAQGLSYNKIAERLKKKFGKKIGPPHLCRAFNKFYDGGTADRIQQAFKELQSVHFWEFQRDYRPSIARANEVEMQMLFEGFWPLGLHSVPLGYVVDATRKLHFDPEIENSLRRALNRVLAGEAPFKVAREEKIDFDRFYYFLRSPFPKGYFRFQRKILPGKHPKYMDDETWNSLQKVLAVKRPPRPKFGFKRTTTGVSVDQEKIHIMRQICILRSQEKSFEKIADTLKISKSNVSRVLNDADYGNVVGNDLWERAHRTQTQFGWPVLKKFIGSRRTKIDTAIILYFQEHGPAYTHQIAKAIKLGDNATRDHLKNFKENGLVEREPKSRGKWFLVNSPIKKAEKPS